MRRNALETMKQYDMLPKGSRVIVGFSGGADSVALLSFFQEVQAELELSIVACHINHQLRGEEAQRDEDFCRVFCAERGIELHVFREDIAAGAAAAGKSVEEFAREIRYERFQQLVTAQSDRIATAHHANDLAETILFHIARGTGLKGLIGIPAVRGNIIRPLLFCSRQEIETYCEEQGLSYVSDSSNASDAYSRNKIRHHVIPQLEEINPAFVKTAVRLSKQAQLEEDYLEKQMRLELERIALGEKSWDRAEFQKLHPAMQKRMAAYWLNGAGAEVSEKKISDVLGLIQQGGTLELCRGNFLQVKELAIEQKEAPKLQSFFSQPFTVGKIRLFEGKNLEILEINQEKFKFFANNQAEDLKNLLDYDKINGIPVLRQKLPGDAIQLKGFTKPRSFKKLLNQKKISMEERSRLVVLCDGKGPLWLEGFGARQDAQPDQKSKHIIFIRVLREL